MDFSKNVSLVHTGADKPTTVTMPSVGFGVYQMKPEVTKQCVTEALQKGYRHVDTAALYKNEAEVGAAVRSCGIKREEIFVTTKLWNDSHGYAKCKAAFAASLERLGLDYVDLYLIHSPPDPSVRSETWKAMEEILDSGKARSIGVSNYGIHHLEELVKEGRSLPAVNQIEVHPFLTRNELVEYCQTHGIVVQAYSPLAKGGVMEKPELVRMAKKYRRTVAQIMIRWSLQRGMVPLPKTTTPARMSENIDVFGFNIADEDMAALTALDMHFVTGWDPTTRP